LTSLPRRLTLGVVKECGFSAPQTVKTARGAKKPMAKKKTKPQPPAPAKLVEMGAADRRTNRASKTRNREEKAGNRLGAVLARHLSKVPDVAAVYVEHDDARFVHVYSVVSDFDTAFYRKLLGQERRIEREMPEVTLEFHVRAHQGRRPGLAVPFGSVPVYLR
jgi:hypothetical protein